MNAIIASQNALAIAAQCLDRRQPTFDDVKNALENAAEAVKFLKAAATLIENGIYTVAEEPVAGTPLFPEDTK